LGPRATPILAVEAAFAMTEPNPRADHRDGTEAFRVDSAFLAHVAGAVYDRDAPQLRRLLLGLHPADIADTITQAPAEALPRLLQLIGQELPPAFLADVPPEKREAVLALLPDSYVADALETLDTDDAAAVAADLDEDRLEDALKAADEDTRLALEQSLAAGEDTAGRLTQREFVAAPEFWTVGDAIDHMRNPEIELPDAFFEIYVIDPRFRPVGVIALATFLRCARETPLREIMTPPQVLIRPQMDQEEVAYVFQRYHLASAPVVDDADRLTGMVTVDDIVHVIKEESGEDLLKLSGVSEASQTDTILQSIQARAPWLLVNMATALVASLVIGQFQGSIEELVYLAVLMPIVASLGGNAGTQALAVAVRALAARDLTPANAWRYVSREAVTAMINGVMIGGALALIAGLVFASGGLALAIFLAVVINLTCAGLAGILAPLTLERFGADPAVSSSVFVTFVTDCVGFLSFLSLATLILL
jgi:magnesium transporter